MMTMKHGVIGGIKAVNKFTRLVPKKKMTIKPAAIAESAPEVSAAVEVPIAIEVIEAVPEAIHAIVPEAVFEEEEEVVSLPSGIYGDPPNVEAIVAATEETIISEEISVNPWGKKKKKKRWEQ